MKYVSEWIEEQTIVKRGYIFAGEALANSSSTFSWCLPFEQETKVWKEQEKEGEKKDRDKTLIFIQRRRHGASVCARIQQKKIACLGLLGIFSSSFWCLCQAGTSMPAGPADPPLPISHIEKWKEGVVDGRQMREMKWWDVWNKWWADAADDLFICFSPLHLCVHDSRRVTKNASGDRRPSHRCRVTITVSYYNPPTLLPTSIPPPPPLQTHMSITQESSRVACMYYSHLIPYSAPAFVIQPVDSLLVRDRTK